VRRGLAARRGAGRTDRTVLVEAYVEDADAMLWEFRAAVLRGSWDALDLPKVILEMVRSLVLVERLALPDAEPGTAAAVWARLTAIERLPAGAPEVDQQLAGLATDWAAFRAAAHAALVRAGADPEQVTARDRLGDPSIGSVCGGTPHSHPTAVGAYLRHSLPCPGLVSTAAAAFSGREGA
jgi:hypothetical protein